MYLIRIYFTLFGLAVPVPSFFLLPPRTYLYPISRWVGLDSLILFFYGTFDPLTSLPEFRVD